jgi:hypothetical protein
LYSNDWPDARPAKVGQAGAGGGLQEGTPVGV